MPAVTGPHRAELLSARVPRRRSRGRREAGWYHGQRSSLMGMGLLFCALAIWREKDFHEMSDDGRRMVAPHFPMAMPGPAPRPIGRAARGVAAEMTG